MSVRLTQVPLFNSTYFITFTCFHWKPLFKLSNKYDAVYSWFDALYLRHIFVSGYVIMPNHLHALLCFRNTTQSLNQVIANGKRFLGYSIIKGLEEKKQTSLLEHLYGSVKESERSKGQRYKVFKDSFDAKECFSLEVMLQKLNYMHSNPVSKKWNLVSDYATYEHSSAGFYHGREAGYKKILHVREI